MTWAHSSLRAAARRITIHQMSLVSRRTPPAHRCPRRRRRQRQRVTEGTAMAPWNGPNKEKNIGKIYSPSGKFAERAKLSIDGETQPKRTNKSGR